MCVKVLVAQSCLTLCNLRDCSPPGSSVHGILQVRILEWVAILFSKDLSDPQIESRSLVLQKDSLRWGHHLGKSDMCVRSVTSVVSDSLPPPWTVAHQAPPPMGFSRQECWSGLPFPSLGDLPDPGIEPGSPTLQADAFNL